VPSYPIKHGPAKIASTLLLPCLLILFASACDKEHQDDKALSEITQSIQLPSGEAQEAPPASRLVITSEGTLYLDLGPLLARSADEAAETVEQIWEEAGEPAARRAFALGTLAEGEDALRAKLETRKPLLEKLYKQKVISSYERHAVILAYDKRVAGPQALWASRAALAGTFSKGYAATTTGAIEIASPKACAATAPGDSDSSRGVRCEFCDQLAGRDGLEDRDCLLPVIAIADRGAYIWTYSAELGRESCVAGYATEDAASAGESRALSPHNALLLEDAKKCPTVEGDNLEESIVAFLGKMEMTLREPLCTQVRIAPMGKTWGDAVGLLERAQAMPLFDTAMLAWQEVAEKDCQRAYVITP
jgi:hypothetical protein